jgi:hypothetical protein
MKVGDMDDPDSHALDFNLLILLQRWWTKKWLIKFLTVSVQVAGETFLFALPVAQETERVRETLQVWGTDVAMNSSNMTTPGARVHFNNRILKLHPLALTAQESGLKYVHVLVANVSVKR